MNFPKGLIRGSVRRRERLSGHTSFKIGGPAAFWIEPADTKELKKVLLYAREKKLPLFVIGGGTNVLARDNGFNGIVIHLGAPFFKGIRVSGANVRVGAGYSTSALVRLCCNKGLSGLESLIGIPGTVGGAVYMNAGGWSSPLYKNIGPYVVSLKVMDYDGNIRILKKKEIKFGYRHSNLSSYIILAVVLKLTRESKGLLTSRCYKFLRIKSEKQALDMPSAGCVFKNPQTFQFTTGQMIDMLGLKGKRMGGAQISPKHANFIINNKGATCGDVLNLIDLVKNKVMENYNIPLELEIKII